MSGERGAASVQEAVEFLYEMEQPDLGDAMAALLDEVVEVLESVEWGDFDGHENRCPECDGREKHGHRSDCRLSALLSRLKREEGGE